MTGMRRAVIFDLGNVLIRVDEQRAATRFLRALGVGTGGSRLLLATSHATELSRWVKRPSDGCGRYRTTSDFPVSMGSSRTFMRTSSRRSSHDRVAQASPRTAAHFAVEYQHHSRRFFLAEYSWINEFDTVILSHGSVC